MTQIRNPILPGFNPDPSICRVADDFYIATSTFEWFPGVQIHHSRDLIHWNLITHALNEKRLLDLQGVPSSGGIWAPALSHHEGLFYLCYTVVHQHEAASKDTPNFLITSPSIYGPWSDPVYINSSGFDPSLFHDDDGKKYWLNMVWDHRPDHHPFYGIVKQELDPKTFQLIGMPKLIFKGTDIGLTEGPHIYKKDSFYYLLTAEGGTEYNHAVTLARSETIDGPYEIHPHNPVLTSRVDDTLALQKAGHASLVETEGGEWYMPHLCGRPLPGMKRCNLGRETAIQKVEWRADGWLYVVDDGNKPQQTIDAPDLPSHPWPELNPRLPFTSPHYATPRGPTSTIEPTDDLLKLYGSESLESCFSKSLFARRLTSQKLTATTHLSFSPTSFQQMAGITAYYNNRLFHHFYLSHDEKIGPCLHIHSCDDGASTFPLNTDPLPVDCQELFLRATFDDHCLRFSWSPTGDQFSLVGPTLDASILSDDYGNHLDFTGTFVGMTCVDLTGMKALAEFQFLEFLT